LILIVLDVLRPLVHKKIIENELEGFGIRLNKLPPNIHFKRKEKGGINYQTMVNYDLTLIISYIIYLQKYFYI
jgi:ribosome-interacting GTPase 1